MQVNRRQLTLDRCPSLLQMDELLVGLANSERELTQDEIETEQEVDDALNEKLETLNATFKKMSQRCEGLRNEVDGLGSAAVLKQKRELLLNDTRKMGAVMESIQDVYKDKLKFAKKKAKNVSVRFTGVREIWRVANDAVTTAQAEYDKCVSRVDEVCSIYCVFIFRVS
jgi:hypothetical protein